MSEHIQIQAPATQQSIIQNSHKIKSATHKHTVKTIKNCS